MVDFFYIVLSAGLAIIIVIFSYTALQAAITFRALKRLLDDVDDTASDLRQLKNMFKWGSLKILRKIVGLLK